MSSGDYVLIFAPVQIYILLALTVSTFAWLVQPDQFYELRSRHVVIGSLLGFVQILQILIYGFVPLPVNIALHSLFFVSYFGVAIWLFRHRWIQKKSAAPARPG